MHTKRQGRQISRTRVFSLGWLIVFAIIVSFGQAKGQALSIFHNFGDGSVTGDGTNPNSSLVEDANGNFYGTTSTGGVAGKGAVFKMAPDGTITILHSFGSVILTGVTQGTSGTLTLGLGDETTIPDGTSPSGNLILASDGFLYGTTASGGSEQYGIVYKISTTGTYSVLYCFVARNQVADGNPDLTLGVYPKAGVIQGQDGNFYGTTSAGGDAGLGVIFRLTSGGTYTVIHDFEAGGDAATPWTGLVQDSQGNFYGTTSTGGTAGMGAVYELDAQGIYSVIYNFTAPSYTFTLNASYSPGGLGGYSPNSGLTIGADGDLYGTAAGAFYGTGAVYKVTPAGQITFLHYFGASALPGDGAEYPFSTAVAGSQGVIASMSAPPASPLVLGTDGNFYGTTYWGGMGKAGIVFVMTPAGQVTVIHAFGDGTVSKDGANPVGLIQGTDGNFYGTTSAGGTAGFGTAFKITATLPMFTSPLEVDAEVGTAFTYQIAATNGPDTFSVSGLSDGLSFDGTSVISGTPTATGKLTLTLTATNGAGTTSVPLVITVLAPPTITSLLNVVGSTTSLGYQIFATGNPTAYTATGLPPGVAVDSTTGLFYGVPTTAGTYQVTVSATNAVGTGSAVVNVQILSAAPTPDQEYSIVHNFQDGSVTGEGSFPGPMILGNDGTFYGVTTQGGATGDGTIFNLTAAGTARVVANLDGANGSAPQGLIQTADGTLYGTTQSGGSTHNGTIFKVTPDGTVTLLHTFGDGSVTNDGANPQAGLVLASDGNFYGTTQYGGSANLGTVFQMTPTGVVTILHSFGDGSVTNDGAQPVAALIVDPNPTTITLTTNGVSTPIYNSHNTLYGTTQAGGAQGDGTIFSIQFNGTVAILHSFGDPTVTNDGQLPHAALLAATSSQETTILLGTTMTGGSIGKGTLFAYSIYPAKMAILRSFGDGSVTNDGENPVSALVFAPPPLGITGLNTEKALIGTTQNGGTAGQGTVFEYTPDGTYGLGESTIVPTTTILHSFGDSAFPNDGQIPLGGVCVGADGNVYGTTVGGGAGSGTAYGLEINQGNPLAGPPSTAFTCTGNIPAGMTFDPTTGLLSGTPLASDATGAYALTITSAGLSGGSSTSQTITITLNQTFTNWITTHSLNSAVATASTSSADGVPLLLKYLFDVSPTAPMTTADHQAMPTAGYDTTTVPGTPYVTLTYRENAGMLGVNVTLETSDDMVTWTPVPSSNLLSQQVGTDASTGDPIMEVGAKADGSPRQFVRLNVSAQ